MSYFTTLLLISALVIWVILIFLIILFLKGANLYDREFFDEDEE